MLLPTTPCLTLAGLLLALVAHAQNPSRVEPPDTTRPRPRPLLRNQLGVGFGFGIATVNPDDDYYLPNDDAKFGTEAGFTYTHFFGRQEPAIGLRTGLGYLSRTGRYRFFGQDVRRAESLLTVPLELVTRRRWSPTSRFYSILALGGYVGELASRTSYTLNPLTSKTERRTDTWLYTTGGVSVGLAVGYQHAHRGARELGIRASSDLFHPKEPDAGQLPNLRQANLTLYYTTTAGF